MNLLGDIFLVNTSVFLITSPYDIFLHLFSLVSSVQVSYEFNLIMQGEKMEDAFVESWQKYSQGIVEYAQATKTKSKELKHALREEDCEGI